jgi:hypothetical protein
MESTPEEWPTSNGMFTKGCMWTCKCETLDAARMMGRGNHSDPNLHTKDLVTYLKPPTDFFAKLYSDLAFTNNTESCVPDCLPATWRMEFARSILLDETNTTTQRNRAHVVPLWYQLVGRISALRPVGDCTHKSLDAVLTMNQQLIRSMIHIRPRAPQLSLSSNKNV